MRDLITNALVIGLSMALLAHFCLIATYGSYTIQEPSEVVLGLEITATIGCIIFAIANIARGARER